MSYQIAFRGPDVPSIQVDNNRGEKVKALWFDGKKDTPIDIDGNAYLVGDIKRITKTPDAPLIDPFGLDRQLAAGPKCRGTFSIQREINNIIKSEGKGWAKKIRDMKYREGIRKKLRSQKGVLWCDNRVEECAC